MHNSSVEEQQLAWGAINPRAWRIIVPATALFVLLCALNGCTGQKRHPVPESLLSEAHPPGMPEVRTWADDTAQWYRQDLVNSVVQETAYYDSHPELKMPSTVDVLTISGGGQHGAFGAGLLCGWTEAGTRPQFKVVTGISTGALISPWAFLGSEYDHVLRNSYTKVSTKDIYKSRGVLAVLFGADSLDDTKPLMEMTSRLVDENLLKAVAAEYAKGRRLLIGTTNLDAERAMIWDMGKIASSGHPQALDLFRQVMVASASIPVGFNPQMIAVEADGKTYDEMHVDGGTTMQVFLWGAGFDREMARRELGAKFLDRPARLYVIRNGVVSAEYQAVNQDVLSIAGAAVSTLIHADLENDLLRLYMIAQREHAEYNLAYIPDDFSVKPTSEFDTKYMDALFDMALKRASEGYHWEKQPPLLKAFESATAAN